MEKKTPAAKTPANNAGDDVNDKLLTAFEMPADPMQRDVLEIAELFRRSGWFGPLTTAQLATLIVVGESIGLNPGQSVFDLTITPADGDAPAAIAYRESQTCQAAGDAADALRAGNASETGNKDVPADKDPAAPAPAAEPAPSNVVQMHPDAKAGDAAANAGEGVTDPTTGDAGKQREYISKTLTELGHSADDVKARIAKFDSVPTIERVKMFEDCAKYYKKKIGDIRYSIIKRLSDDGKTLPAQQAGFYLYADVPTDPAEWSYPDAQKAAAALENFLKRK